MVCSRYKENAVTRSKILHDRATPPIDSAIYWTEYVIRHKGAKHLRPARNDLSLYEVLGIDIALFIFSVAASPVLLLIIISSLLRKRRAAKAKKD